MKFIGGIILLIFIKIGNQTPLDEYVFQSDPHYNYQLIYTYELSDYKVFILNMTSQKWQNENIVQKPIWWHYLSVTVPNKITRPDASLMWIGGSYNREEIPKPTDSDIQLVSNFSLITGTISAIVQQVPNQPYIFNNDPDRIPRSEDEIISWTWKLFLENTSNPTILLRFPMTKAVIKAMDTVEDFSLKNYGIKINKFMTTGKSKRGWTTWTSSAVDNKRVFVAAPIVMDLANLNLNFHNHYKSLGGWTFEFYDYYTQNNLKYIDSRELFELERLVDPLSYFERYKDTQILVMNAANDEFFLPDDTYAYWNNLVAATNGNALLRRFDNVGHSLSGKEDQILESLSGIFISSYEDKLKPRLRWSRPNNSSHGIIKAHIDKDFILPFDIKCFYAFTLEDGRRDFRREEADPSDPSKGKLHHVKWIPTRNGIKTFTDIDQTVYEIAFEVPKKLYLGFYLEFSFKGIDETINIVNTEVNIIPEYYPFDDCFGKYCEGKLV